MNKTKQQSLKSLLRLSALSITATALIAGCSNTPASPEATTSVSPSTEAAVKQELEPVQLVWYLRQAKPNNADSVIKKFNELIYEKIKTTVEFKFINPGDYNEKMQLVMTSGEVYDLSFTSAWANNFGNNVNRGAYVPINEWLDQYPDLKGLFKPEVWRAVSVNDKIYGVPNNQIMANQHGLWFKKDLIDKYNIDVTKITSLDQVESVLQLIKDKEPDIIPIRAGYPTELFFPYYPKVAGLSVDPNTLKVIDQSEEQLARYKVMREWNQKNFFPSDVATMKNEDALIKEGKIFARYSRAKPGNEAELAAKYGYEFVAITSGEAIIEATAVLSTVTAVSRTSKHPNRAVMLLDLINKDKEIYNTLIFGLEGQDYKKTGANRIEPIAEGYTISNWAVGNVFNSYLIPGQGDDVWEATRKLNETAKVDPLISFTFDPTPVESELARLSAAHGEFSPILNNGLDDADKTFAAFQEKRRSSGLDRVIQEVEKQLAKHFGR